MYALSTARTVKNLIENGNVWPSREALSMTKFMLIHKKSEYDPVHRQSPTTHDQVDGKPQEQTCNPHIKI